MNGSVLMVPPPDDEPWPTLGPLVCAFIEENFCHGPGDLLGDPVKLNPEQQAWIYRMYEVHPPHDVKRKNHVISKSKNERAGKRRFTRCALSLRKGSNKTETAAWIAGCELHPDGPVRCARFESVRGVLSPIGIGVSDPYIPMISFSEEQTEELAYGALRRILEKCAIGNDFDIGLERIVRLSGNGKAEAVSASPNARDGARTTWMHADETHRFLLDSLKRAWKVMLANLAKRPLADPWALETTTAPEPGAGSVAESTMEYARQVLKNGTTDSGLFFYHRQASDDHDLTTPKGQRAAVIEASGPYIAKWSDIPRIVAQFNEPDADLPYLERVWTNRLVQGTGRAFNIDQWKALKSSLVVPRGAGITLGFDGGRFDDATALIATHIKTGHQWPLGIWEMPESQAALSPEKRTWEVPVEEVDAAVCDAFERYRVCRMYCDPPKWESWIAKWSERFGKERVVEWWTNRRRQMAFAIRAYVTAIAAAELSHDGNAQFADHIANARQAPTGLVDEEEKPLWVLRKERPMSPRKIDAGMAGILSWEARNDAVAAGEDIEESYQLLFIGG